MSYLNLQMFGPWVAHNILMLSQILYIEKKI